MIGSRAWRALMRRNLVYRRRRWISTTLELFLPVAFIGILIAIRNAVGDDVISETIPASYPANAETTVGVGFADYLTALEAQRSCVAAFPNATAGFSITGIADSGFNWPVGMLKCDPRRCSIDGEAAEDYCEIAVIGVAGSDTGGSARADDFCLWMRQRYPTSAKYEICRRFDSNDAIEDYVRADDYGTSNINEQGVTSKPKLAMGIVFNGNSAETYSYSLRQNSTNFNSPAFEAQPVVSTTPPTNLLFRSRATTDVACSLAGGAPTLGPLQNSCTGQYMYNGVLAFQRLVDDYVLDRTKASESGYFVSEGGVGFVAFPTPAYSVNGFFASIEGYAPLLLALGFLYPVSAMIGYVVGEKELRQKELLAIMSVGESDIGWAWFVTFATVSLISAALNAAASTALYTASAPAYLVVFWVLTALAFIVMCMTLSALTCKSTRGVLIGLLVFLAGVFLTLAVDYETGSAGLISVLSLHPVTAFAYGIQVIGRLEDEGIGLQAGSIASTDAPSGYTFINTMTSLAFDCVLWGLASWYLNRVVRPDYGQALPVWFPFTRSYWCPGRMSAPKNADEDGDDDAESDPEVPVEAVGNALERQGEQGKNIEIHGLRKKFGDKTAVDGLSLKMYSGQITALLGHNGAGKTTTINCLTGAMAADAGYAMIAGKDSRTQMPQIRQDLGICLQHDCLFPLLTVKEHVQFFSRLKGLYHDVSWKDAEASVDQAIQDVALAEKSNTLSKNLSGGMKRKLSVAMAFCGGSKVVILDEPTSGMDPFSRRFTWNVIRNYRKDRCIILTTHFMDEADILGDRIAIMTDGRLCCAGSSLFLKKTYGVGYQLTIEKQDRAAESDANAKSTDLVVSGKDEPTNDDKLKSIVTESVESATLLSNVGSEMTYQLPMGEAGKFVPIFEGLDKEIEKGSVSSYGVSITTLDEVFLLVARGETARKEEMTPLSQRLEEAKPTQDLNKSIRSRMDLENEGLFRTHLSALFKKRAANFKRDRKAWVCTTILPSIFVLVGFLIFAFASPSRDMVPVKLDLGDYNPTATESPRNPINFNSPSDLPFLCQPGVCAYQEPVTFVLRNLELYYFCGYQGRFLFGPNCTINESADITSWLVDDGAQAQPTEVGSIQEASLSLASTASEFAATQYGAIFFSHDKASLLNDGNAFNESVFQVCSSNEPTIDNVPSCSDFGGVGYTIQYNYTAIHVAPLFQALADQSLAREATGSANLTIECTIHPLPITSAETKLASSQDAFIAWFLVVLSFPFITGAFVTFIVSERESKAKHLQTVAGVDPSSYWLSTYLWDVLNYQIALWITVALMFAFSIEVFTTTDRNVVSGVIAVLFLYGPASAGFAYCISFAFTSPSLCNVFVIVSGILVGFGGPLACFILLIIGSDTGNPQQKLLDAANIVAWILRFIPAFNLGNGLFSAINIVTIEFFEGNGELSVWTESVLLYEVIFLAWQSVVYLALAIQLDKWSTNPRAVSYWHKFTRLCTCACIWKRNDRSGDDIAGALPDDDDVLAEEKRILSGEAEDDLIVLRQLTKCYDTGKLAVNNLSFAIPPGECFGLLGINGAGKTSTMAMLTAEFPPSSGDATLAGFSVCNEPEKTRRRIGYCPQFDAHFDNMTGREHVELYAAIKGVPKGLIKEAAAAKLKEVGLGDADNDRLSSVYSGGMKRRLSLACATIGQPQIVFLDECSTGVDPVARREIWQLISDMVSGENVPQEDRTSVILTTHSMEECEALCPRIAIMANGRLRCLGSAQRLKNKFGQGFQLELKVKLVDREDTDFITNAGTLARSKQEAEGVAVDEEDVPDLDAEILFDLVQTKKALGDLSGDDFLSSLIAADNQTGYNIWRDATSVVGASLEEVAAFATIELRMRSLDEFVKESYPNHVLRERQDSKARYEVSSDGVRLASIFSNIESNKERLLLDDYGVSQTSLEQVFNMHAAEAEKLKQGQNDG